MLVKEVITPEECECLTEDNRLLTNINPAWLETVIPKDLSKKVMVVKGRYKNQVIYQSAKFLMHCVE